MGKKIYEGGYYKVVAQWDQRKVSARTGGPYRLVYRKNRPTAPRVGKCFVFSNLDSAIRSMHIGDEVWESVVVNPKRTQVMAKYHCARYKHFWEWYLTDSAFKSNLSIDDVPKGQIDFVSKTRNGTVFADKVKLIRRVL